MSQTAKSVTGGCCCCDGVAGSAARGIASNAGNVAGGVSSGIAGGVAGMFGKDGVGSGEVAAVSATELEGGMAGLLGEDTFIEDLSDDMAGVMEDAGSTMTESVSEGLGGLDFGNIFSGIGSFFKDTFNGLMSGLGSIGSSIGSGLSSAWN